MAVFAYRARDSQGLLITGQVEAVEIRQIEDLLAGKGLIPLNVKPVSGGVWLSSLGKLFRQRVSSTEILVLTRQFYSLFRAGMSMEGILGTLSRQTTNKRLKETLQRIRSGVSSGESLSKAFSEHKDVFSELYVSMLAAGEEAGILEEVLKNLCDLLEKEIEIKSSIKSATLYPKIVIFVLVMASTVIMTFVVPKFASFYGHYKAELPLPTQIMIGTSNFVKNYWFMIGGLAGALWIAFRRYARTVRGGLKVGALRFRIPVFGLLDIKVSNSRFCHILAALYRSGLPMTRCLEITSATLENGAFVREVETLRSDVMQGKTIAEGMGRCRYFTPVIVDATAVGEKTGALDEMLEGMGNHYDLEVKHTIKNLTTLMEPFLLFMIFGMVACFALSIFLPIWNMSKVVSGH